MTPQTLFNGGIVILDQGGTAAADYPRTAGRIGVNYMDSEVIAAALKEAKSSIGKPVLGRKLKMPVFGLDGTASRMARGESLGAGLRRSISAFPAFWTRLPNRITGRPAAMC